MERNNLFRLDMNRLLKISEINKNVSLIITIHTLNMSYNIMLGIILLLYFVMVCSACAIFVYDTV